MGDVVRFSGARRREGEGVLTRLQLRVLNYMRAFEASKHAWPTSDDIRQACGIGPRLGPAYLVCNLVRLGAVPPEATHAVPASPQPLSEEVK